MPRKITAAIQDAKRLNKTIRETVDKADKNSKSHKTTMRDEINKLHLENAKRAVKSSLKAVKLAIRNEEQRNEFSKKMKARRNDEAQKMMKNNRKNKSSNDPAEEALLQAEEDAQAFVKGLDDNAASMQDMIDSAEPIMDDFEELLTMPDIDEFNASLDISPVMGWKNVDGNYKIMYTRNVEDAGSSGGVKSVWTVFSDFPIDAQVTDSSKVFLFPHLGNLMLSVDGKLWRLKCITRDNEDLLFESKHDFRLMYVEEWEKVSDSGIPSDAINVIPYSQMNSAGDTLLTTCIVLDSSKRFMRLKSNDFNATNEWTEVTSESGNEQRNWFCAAYEDSCLLAYAPSSDGTGEYLYTLLPDLEKGSFSIVDDETLEDSFPKDATGFTSNTVGLVSERTNGTLYQRVVEPSSSDPGSVERNWNAWIEREDVRNLGVAAPGFITDLRLVVKILRKQYMTVQTQVAGGVVEIISIANINDWYLNRLYDQAIKYGNDQLSNSEVKQEAEFNVDHVQGCADILVEACGPPLEASQDMNREMGEISNELHLQLNILKNQLEILEDQLESLNEAKQRAVSMLMACMAATILGIFTCVVGVLIASPTVVFLGGAIAVSGCVGIAAAASTIADLNRQISETEILIESTTNAIDSLSSIVDIFDDMDMSFGDIAAFWQGMTSYANSLQDYTEMMEEYGDYLLNDPRVIQAAIDSNTNLLTNAEAYYDMIISQGIVSTGAYAAMKMRYSSTVSAMKKSVEKKDFDGYKSLMLKLKGMNDNSIVHINSTNQSNGHVRVWCTL